MRLASRAAVSRSRGSLRSVIRRALRGIPRKEQVGGLSVSVDRDSETLEKIDQQALVSDFALHALRVREQLSHYADALAEGDRTLRAALRVYETAGLSSLRCRR